MDGAEGSFWYIHRIANPSIVDETHRGRNPSWTKPIMDETHHGRNPSWTKPIMDETHHGRNPSWTKHIVDIIVPFPFPRGKRNTVLKRQSAICHILSCWRQSARGCQEWTMKNSQKEGNPSSCYHGIGRHSQCSRMASCMIMICASENVT